MGYRINYGTVISQANSIGTYGDRLASQVAQLTVMEQTIRSVWQGQAADAFLNKVVTLRSEIDRTKKQIIDLASTIRYCADRIQREDEEAMRRAAALKSGGGGR